MNDAASQARALARMKAIALALLGAAALLYVLATAMEDRHPAWAYVGAFAEAAMIGAMADWFAVVALFRHPLGLPIPHTAIIPTNKARIGQNLAGFICRHFLSTEQVIERLGRLNPAAKLAGWLARPENAARVGEQLAAGLRYSLSALDDERVRHFLRGTLLARLEQVDLAGLAGRLLDVMTADRRHQSLLDEILLQVADLVEDADIQAKIAEVIAAELKYLRYVGLDVVAGNLAAEKIAKGVCRIVSEMGHDPEHPLRLRFDDYMAGFIARLKEDPEFRLRGEAIRDEVLAHPELGAYLHGLWRQLLDWLNEDLGREDSTIRARVSQIALTLGGKLQADAAMQQWINAQVLAAAPRWVERYREDIRRYIVERVDAWNTQELTNELERNIGRDLQFVRINGTLVGGLIGVVIHALTHWVRG